MQQCDGNPKRFYVVVISTLLVWFAELAVMALVN
jgi:hypothetical protein